MDILQYAERISTIPLSLCQKQILLAYQEAREKNLTIVVNYPSRVGRTLVKDIICKFEGEMNGRNQ